MRIVHGTMLSAGNLRLPLLLGVSLCLCQNIRSFPSFLGDLAWEIFSIHGDHILSSYSRKCESWCLCVCFFFCWLTTSMVCLPSSGKWVCKLDVRYESSQPTELNEMKFNFLISAFDSFYLSFSQKLLFVRYSLFFVVTSSLLSLWLLFCIVWSSSPFNIVKIHV